jgi:hypothetical protein
MCLRLLLFFVLPRGAAAKDKPGLVRLEENTLPVLVLGVLCDFFFCISSFACYSPIICGMRIFSFL